MRLRKFFNNENFPIYGIWSYPVNAKVIILSYIQECGIYLLLKYLQVSSSVRGLKLMNLEGCCYLGQTWNQYQ